MQDCLDDSDDIRTFDTHTHEWVVLVRADDTPCRVMCPCGEMYEVDA